MFQLISDTLYFDILVFAAVAQKTIMPYSLEVTHNNTTHIIFPDGVAYVDLGSVNLITGKVDGAENYLLRNTDKTIAEISIEVGFATPANFSKYYKVMYETIPSKIDRY